MKIRPLNNFLVIRKTEVEEKTQSGILLMESTIEDEKAKKSEGVVVETNEFSPVKKGDTVIYRKWSEDAFKLDGEELFFIQNEDLLGELIS